MRRRFKFLCVYYATPIITPIISICLGELHGFDDIFGVIVPNFGYIIHQLVRHSCEAILKIIQVDSRSNGSDVHIFLISASGSSPSTITSDSLLLLPASVHAPTRLHSCVCSKSRLISAILRRWLDLPPSLPSIESFSRLTCLRHFFTFIMVLITNYCRCNSQTNLVNPIVAIFNLDSNSTKE